jgi:adenylate cyclase
MSTVLLVDDEQANLDVLEEYIKGRHDDWMVLRADTVASAGDSLAENSIDVVVTDLVLGDSPDDQGGMEVLQLAKSSDPRTIVIIVTAFENKLKRYKAYELGAFDCIAKTLLGREAIEEIAVKVEAGVHWRQVARFCDPRIQEQFSKDPSELELSERPVAIVFWDIRQFSKLCKSLNRSPNLVSGFLREYLEMVESVVVSEGGMIDKFIGDGAMALFGAFQNSPDNGTTDCAQAVKSALRIRDKFQGIKEKWMHEFQLAVSEEVDCDLGCGIHSSMVLVGIAGTKTRDQFTALGHGVNLAQRFESQAGKEDRGSILITQPVKERVSDVFLLEKESPISDARNIQGNHPAFSVKGIR